VAPILHWAKRDRKGIDGTCEQIVIEINVPLIQIVVEEIDCDDRFIEKTGTDW